MKVNLRWLKDFVDTELSVEDLAHMLTMAGLEVERIDSAHGDTVLELEVTPNRPDCLSIIGIAREISAITNKALKKAKYKSLPRVKQKCSVSIESPDDCRRYIGTIINNVKVSASPAWLTERILPLGLRPINNLVDITNYGLMENGQPLHAFDYDKLAGGQIIVRRAKKGERIVTLDGIERELDPSILIIADAEKPVAIAGIMGGIGTEVTASTKTVLLESALFNQILIRRTARKLALHSDSSYRFERGVVFEGVEAGAHRAVELITDLAGGQITAYTDAGARTSGKKIRAIKLFVDRVNGYLGSKITPARCQTILKKLEFNVESKGDGVLVVTPPSFRNDIHQDVDVIEEVARVIGYDNLPSSLPTVCFTEITPDKKRLLRQKCADWFTSQGFSEVITYTMINQPMLDKTGLGDLIGMRIKNPLTQDQEMMRPALLPSLMNVVLSNINRGQRSLKIFEQGKIYSKKSEYEVFGVILTGERCEDWRISSKSKADYYDMKGPVDAVLARAGLTDLIYAPGTQSFFEPGQTADIYSGKTSIGFLGKLKEEILLAWGIKQADVFYAQLDYAAVYRSGQHKKSFIPIAEYPSIVRDVSLAVKEQTTFQDIQNVIRENAADILKDITFNEEYLGEKIQSGFRGLVFSLQYQSSKRTLREEEVNELHARIEAALIEQLGVIKR